MSPAIDGAGATMRAHDENFPVAFMRAPHDVRADMAVVYAFCRTTDDIGDEGPGTPAERLAELDRWEADLRGGSSPLAAAVADLAMRRAIPLPVFLRLIEANRMDQRRSRWDTRAELIDYCRHSATPVGEMVLGVLGHHDAWRVGLSDETCIGLQLVNFWQDVARDLRGRGRVYLPREAMAAHGVTDDDLGQPSAGPAVRALIADEVNLARAHLEAGAALHRFVPRRVALDLRMFTEGGLALCDAIAARDHDTLSARTAPGRVGRARIAGRALWRAARGR